MNAAVAKVPIENAVRVTAVLGVKVTEQVL